MGTQEYRKKLALVFYCNPDEARLRAKYIKLFIKTSFPEREIRNGNLNFHFSRPHFHHGD
jgi:hypothetical protein